MKGHKYNLRPRQSLKNPTFFRYLHEDNFPYLTAELERKTPQSDTESEDTTSTDTFTYFTSPSSDEEDNTRLTQTVHRQGHQDVFQGIRSQSSHLNQQAGITRICHRVGEGNQGPSGHGGVRRPPDSQQGSAIIEGWGHKPGPGNLKRSRRDMEEQTRESSRSHQKPTGLQLQKHGREKRQRR